MAIEAEISKLKFRLFKLEKVRENLYTLLSDPFNKEIGQESSISKEIMQKEPDSIQEVKSHIPEKVIHDFSDYPKGESFRVKMAYLDMKIGKAFRMRERLELIGQLEGETVKAAFEKKLSTKLNYLVKTGYYIAAKYNGDNKLVFYFRPEWLDKTESGYIIKKEFAPTIEQFKFMSEYQRREENIIWFDKQSMVK